MAKRITGMKKFEILIFSIVCAWINEEVKNYKNVIHKHDINVCKMLSRAFLNRIILN